MHIPLAFTGFRVWSVVVPARHDILSAPAPAGVVYEQNLSWPDLPIHLVEGRTTAGFTAVGECGRGTPRSAVEATLRDLLGRDLLTGAPPTLWMRASEPGGLPPSYPLWSWHAAGERSYILAESLWLDAVGKASGLPAHQLLGGAVRDRVPVDFWANRPPADVLAKLVAEADRKGLRGMKLKSDAAGDTVHALVAIARDVPAGFHFTIDPMCAWRTLRESRRLFEQLASLPFEVQIEDPFAYLMIEDWRQARALGHTTIICHARDEQVLRLALREQMADALNLGGGGAYAFLQMATVAEFAGKDCWQGSALELGVLQHLHLHASACARNCLLPSDLQSEWVREHTLVTPRMHYEDGCAVLPGAPGLGVALDLDAAQRYCVDAFEVT
jgi:L-alanine-DL-glutamate epimerase-like enolase superfamily enzyme